MIAAHGMANEDNKSSGRGDENQHHSLSGPPLKKRKSDGKISSRSSSSKDLRTTALLRWLVGSFHPLDLIHKTPMARDGFLSFCQSINSNFSLPTLDSLATLADQRYRAIQDELRDHIRRNDCEYLSVSIRRYLIRPIRKEQNTLSVNDQPVETYFPVHFTFCTSRFERKSITAAVIKETTIDESKSITEVDAVEQALSMLKVDKKSVVSLCILPSAESNEESRATEGSWMESIPGKEKGRRCVLGVLDSMVAELTRIFFLGLPEVESWTLPINVSASFDTDHRHLSTQITYRHLQTASEIGGYDILSIKPRILAVLAPFKDAIDTISSDLYPTIGLTISILRRIQSVLDDLATAEECEKENERSDRARDVANGFLDAIQKKFSLTFETFLSETASGLWTIPLDPRLVLMNGLSDSEQEKVKTMLWEQVKSIFVENKQNVDAARTTQSHSESGISRSTMGGLFLGDLEDDAPKSIVDAEAYAKSNVESYFTAASSRGRIEDPLLWWSCNQGSFPELAILARKWLGTTAIYAGPIGSRMGPHKVIPIRGESEHEIIRMIYLHENQLLI